MSDLPARAAARAIPARCSDAALRATTFARSPSFAALAGERCVATWDVPPSSGGLPASRWIYSMPLGLVTSATAFFSSTVPSSCGSKTMFCEWCRRDLPGTKAWFRLAESVGTREESATGAPAAPPSPKAASNASCRVGGSKNAPCPPFRDSASSLAYIRKARSSATAPFCMARAIASAWGEYSRVFPCKSVCRARSPRFFTPCARASARIETASRVALVNDHSGRLSTRNTCGATRSSLLRSSGGVACISAGESYNRPTSILAMRSLASGVNCPRSSTRPLASCGVSTPSFTRRLTVEIRQQRGVGVEFHGGGFAGGYMPTLMHGQPVIVCSDVIVALDAQ